MKWLELPVRNTKLHGKITTMIRLKYAPIGKSRLYTMYKQYLVDGICAKEWHIAGRLPLMTVTDINRSVEEHHQSTGRAVTGSDIESILLQARKDDAELYGIDQS